MKIITIIKKCANCDSVDVVQWPGGVSYCKRCRLALPERTVNMCIKRYRTSKGVAKIWPHTFDRETDKYLIKNGRRVAKRGNWDNYYLTFKEAKEAIVSRAMVNVKGCHDRLTEANIFLYKAQSIEILQR